jgi:hypothetical protein
MDAINSSMYAEYNFPGEEALSEEFNELASFYSDFHKDVYGFRPRHMALCACDYKTRDDLIQALADVREEIQSLKTHLKEQQATFDGRERLREDGWYIEETEPELIEKARLLAKKRDEDNQYDY